MLVMSYSQTLLKSQHQDEGKSIQLATSKRLVSRVCSNSVLLKEAISRAVYKLRDCHQASLDFYQYIVVRRNLEKNPLAISLYYL